MKSITLLLMIVFFQLQAAQKGREIKSSHDDRGWTIITGDGGVLEPEVFDHESLPNSVAPKKEKLKKRKTQKCLKKTEKNKEEVKFFIGDGDQDLRSLPASPERPQELKQEIVEVDQLLEQIEDNRDSVNSSPLRPLPRVNTSSESLVDLCVEVDEFARKVGGWFVTAGQDIWGAVKQSLFKE